ncbi:MAG: hypothetical protein JST90_08005 [Bacteroidetes bacterium]|nr:hypothetical protein [Bacteroidota bacterium]
MRHLPLLILLAVIVLSSSCGQQSHGRRHLSVADSLRRVHAIAEEAHLNDMEEQHEALTGPLPDGGKGIMLATGPVPVPRAGDSIAIILRAHERFHHRLAQALADSTTLLGALITRVLVLDTSHRYMTATYSYDGHLLTFHAENTADEHRRYEYDLCFDHGRLVHLHERRTFAINTEDDDQQQEAYTDDTYYLWQGRAIQAYREQGQVVHHMDHIEFIPQGKAALTGDVAGHMSMSYEDFKEDYNLLQQRPMEMLVYTAAPPAAEGAAAH